MGESELIKLAKVLKNIKDSLGQLFKQSLTKAMVKDSHPPKLFGGFFHFVSLLDIALSWKQCQQRLKHFYQFQAQDSKRRNFKIMVQIMQTK